MSDHRQPLDPARAAGAPAGWRRTLVVFAATGGGLGLCPVASGTVGSLPGVLLVAALWPVLPGTLAQAAVALALAAVAVPLCDGAERAFGRKDDGRIVADEYLTFPLALVGLPVSLDAAWFVAAAFVLARAMDVLKPWPANRLQSLRGGAGIVADDVVASLYALAANHLLHAAALRAGLV
jgi:phosphatidylglycerophosphatase A